MGLISLEKTKDGPKAQDTMKDGSKVPRQNKEEAKV